MAAVHTILCPVDFSDATPRQVDLGAGLASLFGARLVLHHNMAGLAPGAGVGWMWSGDHPPLSVETVGQRLEELVINTAPGLEVELRISEGPASSAVLAVSEAVGADLVLLSTHPVPAGDHTSVTEEVLKRTHRSVLALHDAPADQHAFTLGSAEPQVTLVPTDLTPESQGAVTFAFELAQTLPLELHLVHFLPRGARSHGHGDAEAEAGAERALRALVPTAFAATTRVHVRQGEPRVGIVQAALELGAACIIMGEHTRAPLRRWFSHDTSHGVLHEAPCPVWYVSGQHAA